MRKLKRMLLIHWHNYVKEVIEFDTINFLTGKTAAGKSTIIDALQLILLGDTTGSFFNKAANQKSDRTLKGYLFGEKGDDGDTGFKYMRNQRFTSYVALEFEDTEKEKCFVTGLVCDCYKDQSFDSKWFIIHNNGFPDNLFIDEETKKPYDIAGLRAYLNYWLESKSAYELPETNKRYQDLTAGKFGSIKSKYRTLLKKAVPFTPIANIEQFITESICDVKNEIDIEQMQVDIRQYKSLEHDAVILEKRVEHLKQIREVSELYENQKEKNRQQNYIAVRAELEAKKEKEKELLDLVKIKEDIIEQQKAELEGILSDIKILNEEKSELEKEYHTSDIRKKGEELSKKLRSYEEKIKTYEDKVSQILLRMKTFEEEWMSCVEKLETTKAEILDKEIDDKETVDKESVDKENFGKEAADKESTDRGSTDKEPAGIDPVNMDEFKLLLKRLTELDEKTVVKYDFLQAVKLFQRIQSEVRNAEIELKRKAQELKRSLDELKKIIKNLEQGIKPYPDSVVKLKAVIEAELYNQYDREVKVNILADLLEINDQKWRNAIEGYLDKQKFYLIVEPEYFSDALRIYDRVKSEKKIHDIGLVDIDKMRQNYKGQIMENSLAGEIETSDPNARLFADFILGKVIKCEKAEELRKYPISITYEGMLYKGFVARNINPKRYVNPYIGRKSMEILLDSKIMECKEIEKQYGIILNNHRIVSEVSAKEILTEYEAKDNLLILKDNDEIGKLKQERIEVQKEYDELDFLHLDKIKEKIKERNERIETKNNTYRTIDNKNVALTTEIKMIRENQLPEYILEITRLNQEIGQKFELSWINEIGNPRFRQETAGERTYENIRSSFFSAMRKSEKKKEEHHNARIQIRSEYNKEYKMSYDVNLESNHFFDGELDALSDVKLPEYLEKIKDAKEKAYSQFRDDFIAKIKSNIESVTMQVRELNDSLKHSIFGTDTYRFEKKPRPEYRAYYDMIMDPLLMDTGGYNIASESFNQKYEKEIGELFQQLIYNETEVSAERRSEYEKQIKKFTDYKTYLLFDLVVTNDKGEEQRLSKTLLKKSGGETQIPFYISLLASFSQVCRIRTKNNNTIRIIILDEAFSKMDGERIKESIRLLRKFDLQAIFSAPPDKIPDIAPLVDRNIAVFKDSNHSFTKYFDPKKVDEELLMEEV